MTGLAAWRSSKRAGAGCFGLSWWKDEAKQMSYLHLASSAQRPILGWYSNNGAININY
jgi:hypothetical protein